MAPLENSYKVAYRDVKYPRLEFKTGQLQLILPHGKNAKNIISKHQKWIQKKEAFIEECLQSSQNKKLISRTDEEFRDLVRKAASSATQKLKVSISNLLIRKMNSKWASCSSKGNITINKLMIYLPAYLIEYIIFHEIAHIIERKHNEKFWTLLEKEFQNYQDLEKELFVYWFKVNKETALKTK